MFKNSDIVLSLLVEIAIHRWHIWKVKGLYRIYQLMIKWKNNLRELKSLSGGRLWYGYPVFQISSAIHLNYLPCVVWVGLILYEQKVKSQALKKLEKCSFKVDPWLVSQTFFRKVPTTPLLRGSLYPTVCIYNMVYPKHLLFF